MTSQQNEHNGNLSLLDTVTFSQFRDKIVCLPLASKSAGAQVPYIKWHSTLNTLYLWVLLPWIVGCRTHRYGEQTLFSFSTYCLSSASISHLLNRLILMVFKSWNHPRLFPSHSEPYSILFIDYNFVIIEKMYIVTLSFSFWVQIPISTFLVMSSVMVFKG